MIKSSFGSSRSKKRKILCFYVLNRIDAIVSFLVDHYINDCWRLVIIHDVQKWVVSLRKKHQIKLAKKPVWKKTKFVHAFVNSYNGEGQRRLPQGNNNMSSIKQNNLIFLDRRLSTRIHCFFFELKSVYGVECRHEALAQHTNCRHCAVVGFNVTVCVIKPKTSWTLDVAQFNQLDFKCFQLLLPPSVI